MHQVGFHSTAAPVVKRWQSEQLLHRRLRRCWRTGRSKALTIACTLGEEPAGESLPWGLLAGATVAMGIAINRVAFTDALTGAQSRADLLGLAVAGLLSLLGFTQVDVEAKVKESVELEGVQSEYTDVDVSPNFRNELLWAADTLMSTTNVRAMFLFSQGEF